MDREILLNPIYIKRGPAMDTEFWFSQPRALEKTLSRISESIMWHPLQTLNMDTKHESL